jgi:ribonucleotide reductase alpha subunit
VGVNPCKPLHSTILTPTGYITFKEALEKPELTVVLPTGGTAKATKPFKTGTNRIVQRLKLRNGSYVYGTENHKHKTKKGVWVEMKDIQVGDKLAFSIPQLYVPETHEALMSNRDYQKGLLHGWVFADGSVSSSTDVNVCFGVNEFDTSEFFKDTFGLNVRKHGQKPDTCKVATIPVSVQKEFGGFARQADLGKEDLTWLLGETFHTKLGFIRAAFTADGSVRKKNNVELYSISRASLETLQTVLAEMGIYSSIQLHNNSKTYIANDGKTRNNKTVHKLNVYAGQFARIGFISEFKNNRLAESTQECAIYRYKDYQTVVEIEREFSVEDVYDITVDHPSHAFIDSGIVTHNCGEASLRAFSFCNLVDINAQKVLNQKDFIDTCEAAAFINTLQASYTDFKYLRPIWKERTEEDALIGVGITGIAGGNLDALDLHAGSEAVMSENARVAAMIGINPAARCCLIKPSGTTSLVLATSNGIHDWHDHYYIRRAQVNKKEAIYQYLIQTFPALVEDLLSDPDNTAVLSFPQKAPDLASVAPNSNALSILERCKRYNLEWIRPAHRSGANYHNVSATVYVEDDEMDSVRDWLWENRFTYHGLTVFPVNNHTYKQTPFESCTKEVYEKMLESFVGVDLTQVLEEEDFTNLNEQAACFGGVCTII